MSRRDGILVHQLSSILPDDRPITAICVIEDIDKCPPNFTVVSRTYDLDVDADLWRESGIFIKKKTRYLCFSKIEGSPYYIIENILVIDEKETPPEGFCIISQTVDSRQRAWRKRQLCYKLKLKDLCTKAVSDIIICSRIGKGARKAPSVEFSYAGMISGVSLCYKTVDLELNNSHSYVNIELCPTASPNPSNGSPHRIAPERPPKPIHPPKSTNSVYPQIKKHIEKFEFEDDSDRNYEVLSPNAVIKPTRPAPQPPKTSPAVNSFLSSYGTLSGNSDLDGIPFVLHPNLNFKNKTNNYNFPIIKLKTKEELDKEYFYDFRAEKET